MIADVQVQEQHTLLWLNPPEKNNFQETVLKRLETIENGQMNIMMKLSELSAQIERAFFARPNKKSLVLLWALSSMGIDSVEDLEQFNELLKDKESSDKLKEKLAVVCGTGKGTNLFFTRGCDVHPKISHGVFVGWAVPEMIRKKPVLKLTIVLYHSF